MGRPSKMQQAGIPVIFCTQFVAFGRKSLGKHTAFLYLPFATINYLIKNFSYDEN